MRGQALIPRAILAIAISVAGCAAPRAEGPTAPVVHVAPAPKTKGAWLETQSGNEARAPAARRDGDDDDFSAGDRLEVEWHGSWYPATVLAVEPGGRYLIHYVGYGKEWDEVVGPDRMRQVTESGDDEDERP